MDFDGGQFGPSFSQGSDLPTWHRVNRVSGNTAGNTGLLPSRELQEVDIIRGATLRWCIALALRNSQLKFIS